MSTFDLVAFGNIIPDDDIVQAVHFAGRPGQGSYYLKHLFFPEGFDNTSLYQTTYFLYSLSQEWALVEFIHSFTSFMVYHNPI